MKITIISRYSPIVQITRQCWRRSNRLIRRWFRCTLTIEIHQRMEVLYIYNATSSHVSHVSNTKRGGCKRTKHMHQLFTQTFKVSRIKMWKTNTRDLCSSLFVRKYHVFNIFFIYLFWRIYTQKYIRRANRNILLAVCNRRGKNYFFSHN